MSEEAVVMLMIMFQTQPSFKEVSDELLEKLLECKWLAPVLYTIYQKDLDILSVLIPLLKACFKHIQDTQSNFAIKCKNLCEI